MKIVVIYKWAPTPQTATVDATGKIDWGTKRAISEYDPVAIHAARIFANSYPGEVELIGLTAAEASGAAQKATQAAAARGLDSLYVVADDALQGVTADVYARVLAAGISQIGDVDLIIAGDASADIGGQAVPGLLAGHFGIPAFADVQTLRCNTAGQVEFTRHALQEQQTITLTSPAVLSLSTDAAPIPLIGMKDMMAARKKPVQKLTLSDVDPAGEIAAQIAKAKVIAHAKPAQKPRKNIIFDSTDAAEQLVAALRAEGVIS